MDGTLIDIAPRPDAVKLDQPLLLLLERLRAACGAAIAVISGRALADIEHRLGELAVGAAGQHGLERRDAAGRLHCRASPPDALLFLKLRLTPLLARHPTLLLEDKGLTLALHYRQAPHLAAYLHRLLPRLVAEAGEDLAMQRGKRVLEIKPKGIDKGTAIEQFLREPPFRGRQPVFIGDDATDEHGFAVVNRLQGISVKVGSGATCAHHRLRNVEAVRSWLSIVAGVTA